MGVPPFAIRERALKESAKQNLSALAATLASEVSLTPQERALNEEVRSVVIDAQKEVSLLMPEGVIDDGLKIHHKKISASFGELGSKVNEYLTLVHGHSTQKRAYDLFFQGIFVSLGSAMFSLLGFYIASAAYRAFRVRSTESALMMGAALLVILGQIPFALFGSGPFGEYLHELFPRIRLWLLTVPNTAAFRAIEIGSAVGALIMGVRMWFSIESESFSEGEKR